MKQTYCDRCGNTHDTLIPIDPEFGCYELCEGCSLTMKKEIGELESRKLLEMKLEKFNLIRDFIASGRRWKWYKKIAFFF